MTTPTPIPPPSRPELAALRSSSSWSSYPSSAFGRASLEADGARLAILPVHGWGDHGLGLSNDVEEVLGSALLQHALSRIGGERAVRCLPPVRHVLAPYPPDLGSVDPETAHMYFREIAAGVKAAGFDRLLFFNTSPWNGELVDAVSRDVRVEQHLQTFVIELSGLGIDLHPGSPQRARAQALAAAILGRPPDAPNPKPQGPAGVDRGLRPGNWRDAPDVIASDTIDTGARLQESSTQLAGLLVEVMSRAPLGGVDTRPLRVEPSAFTASSPQTVFPADRRVRYLPALSKSTLARLEHKDRGLVILPVGAIEQHGPHLPVGVDALLGEAACQGLHRRLPAEAPVWFGPSFPLGKSNEHLDYPGTVSLGANTLRRLIIAQVDALQALGFRQFALLNTHGGNSAVLVYTLREIQQRWNVQAGMLKIPTTSDLSAQEATWGFHAGEWETSLMLSLRPDLVNMKRAICHYPARLDDPGQLRPENAPAIFSWMTRDIAPSGVMGDATIATAEKGQRWFDAAMDDLAAQVMRLVSR